VKQFLSLTTNELENDQFDFIIGLSGSRFSDQQPATSNQ